MLPTLLLLLDTALSIQVFSTTSDYHAWSQGRDSGAALVPSSLPEPFPDLTLCWRFYEFAITNSYLISSYLPPSDAANNEQKASGDIIKVDNSPREDGVSKYLGLLHRGNFYESHWPPRRWHHVCTFYQGSTGRIAVVSDGEKVHDTINESVLESKERFTANTLKKLNMMRHSGTGHSGIFGMMTDVNMWSSVLHLDTIISWTRCEDTSQGDLLAWETSSWRKTDLTEISRDRASLCVEKELGLTILPVIRSFGHSRDICLKLGGRMGMASTPARLDRMVELLVEHEEVCPNKRVYAGFTDKAQENRLALQHHHKFHLGLLMLVKGHHCHCPKVIGTTQSPMVVGWRTVSHYGTMENSMMTHVSQRMIRVSSSAQSATSPGCRS